jgi:DNA-binding Lrp family transcriptional regulator
VSRAVKNLERKGVIKEYTIIPDFGKLGYGIMGVTFIRFKEPQDDSSSDEVRETVSEIEKKKPHASLMAVSGVGSGKDKMFITFYEDYSAYSRAMQLTRQIPYVNVDSLESFMVDINDKSNHRLLSMSAISRHVISRKRA